MTSYEKAIAAGLEIDHHETDLYIKDCPEARKIVGEHFIRGISTMFRSSSDGSFWWDIPFAYDPAWERKAKAV